MDSELFGWSDDSHLELAVTQLHQVGRIKTASCFQNASFKPILRRFEVEVLHQILVTFEKVACDVNLLAFFIYKRTLLEAFCVHFVDALFTLFSFVTFLKEHGMADVNCHLYFSWSAEVALGRIRKLIFFDSCVLHLLCDELKVYLCICGISWWLLLRLYYWCYINIEIPYPTDMTERLLLFSSASWLDTAIMWCVPSSIHLKTWLYLLPSTKRSESGTFQVRCH